MTEDNGLQTEQQGARFTLTSHGRLSDFTRFAIAANIIAALLMFPGAAIGVSRHGWSGWGDIVLLAVILTSALAFALFMTYLLSPRALVTVFDSDAKSIVMDFSVFENLYARRTELSFADIDGVGVRAVDMDDDNVWSFQIVMIRKNGKIVALEIANAIDGLKQEICEHIVQQICKATGLPRLDRVETGCPDHHPPALIMMKTS